MKDLSGTIMAIVAICVLIGVVTWGIFWVEKYEEENWARGKLVEVARKMRYAKDSSDVRSYLSMCKKNTLTDCSIEPVRAENWADIRVKVFHRDEDLIAGKPTATGIVHISWLPTVSISRIDFK